MEPLLSAERISYAYESIRAVHDVSWAIFPGQVIGLLGPNGSGKSTLLKIAAGILKPDSGTVRLRNLGLAGKNLREIGKAMAYVPQGIGFEFPFTVAEFVSLGRAPHLSFFGVEGPEDRQAIRKALEVTHCSDLTGRPVTALSGGEQQRALLAQALAQEAEILLLDEPASHLDIGYQIQIMRVIRQEARNGRCVLASLHDLNLASQFCDRLLLLCKGTLLADGTPREVLVPELVEEAYGVKTRIVADPGLDHPLVIPRT